MEQAPATFQRTFPDALRRHLRHDGVLEYFEEVAERPREHAVAGVIRELFPDGESDLIFRGLSYLRLPPLPSRDSRTSSGRAVRPPTSLFDPDYHLNLPQQQVSGKPRKPKSSETDAPATPSKADAPDTEAQAKPVAPTPTDATPSKGYVKMKARKTIEAERAALLASQQTPQPLAEDKTPTCSVCGNPVNLFSPDGTPASTCCSQCVRTSTGAPIKRKRPETDPPQELKKRRDPDQDGDGPPQGPASSQAAASVPQASATSQQSASASDPSAGSAPHTHWRPGCLSGWFAPRAGIPRSTPVLPTAFPSGQSRLRAGHPRRATGQATSAPALAQHLLRHHGLRRGGDALSECILGQPFPFSISVSPTSTEASTYSADRRGGGREGPWCCAA